MNIFFPGLQEELLAIHDSFEKRAEKYKDPGIIKQAFDTRRINSGQQLNPRRNLQNYQRSDQFISSDMAAKIKNLFKVKNAADQIKEQFIGDPDWLDSNSRILCNALDNTLRVDQKDYDFFKPQFDYLDEILYLRYRLASYDIERLTEEEIKSALFNKDEKLMYKSIYANYKPISIQKSISTTQGVDTLTEKLFGGIKADSENKSVERSINIIIKDSILDEKEIIKKTEKIEEVKTGEENRENKV